MSDAEAFEIFLRGWWYGFVHYALPLLVVLLVLIVGQALWEARR